MDRAEATGLGVAVIGHIVLFGLLSLSLIRKPTPLPINDPVEVQLVDDLGLRSAQPKAATADPAPSFAPDIAPPASPAPASPAPSPQPVIKPKPKPKADPQPSRTPAASIPKPSHLATDLALASTAVAVAKSRGARLSANFLDGISDKPSTGTSKVPKAATIDAKAIASISDALRRQVQPCADRMPYPGPSAERIHTKLVLHFNKDGSLASAPAMVAQTGVDDDNRRYAQRVKELAVAAYAQCAPYHLPPELYADSANRGWNNISATFTLRSPAP